MYPVKQSTALDLVIFAMDANGDGVTGKVDGDWTKRISKNGAAFAAMTVTVTERENGFYHAQLSTSHTDTLGILTVSFSATGVKRVNFQVRVHARLPDDLCFPTTSGNGIDVQATGVLVSQMALAVITASSIASDAITAAKIAPAAIDAATFTVGAIDASAIATGAITAAKFAAGAIDAAAIAADAITGAKVASDVTIASVTGAVGSVTGNVGGNVTGSVGSLAAQAKLDVNAEVDTALADVNLDHLVGTATGIPAIPAGTYLDQIMDDGTAVYDRTTDSLQAVRDATLSTNVVSIGANVITATSIAADAITAAKIANGAIDAATFAAGAIDAAAIASGAITAAKFGAGAVDAAALATDAVNEIRDAVWAKTMTELASVPGVTADVLSALEWLFLLGRNKITQTATTQTLRNDADSATIGSSTVSDDATTFIRGEFA